MPSPPRTAPSAGRTPTAQQVSTRDLLNTLFYYRWTAASVVAGFLLLGLLVALLVPPTYRAESRLLTLYAGYYDMQIDRQTNRAAPSFDPAQVVNVETQILTSPELHRAIVAERLGPSADPEAVEKAFRRFEDHFHLEKIEGANVIDLSYVDSDPRLAAEVLKQLIERYFRQRAGVFSIGRVEFLVAQRDKVRAQLDKANAQLIAFQRSHNVLNIDAQIASAVALHSLLRQRGLENDSSFAQDASTLETLRREAAGVPATIELFSDNTEAAHAVDTMHLTLLQLQSRRADLAARYLDGAPFVRQMDQQIEDVKEAIAGRTPHLVSASRTGHNSYYDTVQDRLMRLSSDVAGERARKEELERQGAEAATTLQTLISVANQLRRMEIDRDLLVESFKKFSRELEQARIEQNQVDTASSTNVRIIQAPQPPTRRSNPPLLFVGIGLLVGLLAAGLTVMVRSTLRETFLSPEEAERRLGLPVLCAPMGPPHQPPPALRALAALLRRRPAAPAGAPT